MDDFGRIDHVGIAVDSLEKALPLWSAILGQEAADREEVPDEGVRVAFFGEGPGRVELLESTGDDTPVGRFLERRGAGIHHLCLQVRDLELAIDRARAAGGELLPPGIRSGAGQHRVAFLHPSSTGGVLLELSERPGRG